MASLDRFSLSEGERTVYVSYFVFAVVSGFVGFAASERLATGGIFHQIPSYYELWTFLAGMSGGLLGLFVSRRFFGNSGAKGWVRFLLGAISVMMISSVAGGTLALPFFGTMFGPLALVGTFIAYPLIAGFWLLSLILAHVARGSYLRERDTIFRSSFPYA